MDKFPLYLHHETISCFNCSSIVLGGTPSGHAEGRGAYKAFCAKCRLFTFYDIL